MGFERQWAAVPLQAFTANGSPFGLITVVDTAGFRVKMVAAITSNTLPPLPVQIKIVLSPTVLIVGKVDNQIANWPKIDLTPYTIAINSGLTAERQEKNKITGEDIVKATYEADPVAAERVIPVDIHGDFFSQANPIPVSIDSEITIGEVEVIGPSGHLLDPNSDGSIKTVQLFTIPFDTITATYPTSTQEVYKSRVGGIVGIVQQTLTVNYTDATKNFLMNVVRS